ncbi:hypothetical protein AC1031_002161 [Aphanomyces cochlioides]|nr:hypothetical protein AC1031_002161 [Aphanomyces cochlioides]
MAGLINHLLRAQLVKHTSLHVVNYEIASHLQLPAPFEQVSRATWEVFSLEEIPHLSPSAQEVHEQIDDFTIYKRFIDTSQGAGSLAYTVRKLFQHKDEHLIVVQAKAL